MDSLIQSNIGEHQKESFIKIGDNSIPVDKGFQIILTAKFLYPSLNIDYYRDKITLIDMSLCEDAFRVQSFSLLISKEKPDLAEMQHDVNIF